MQEKQNLFAYIIGIGFLILTTFGGTYAVFQFTGDNSNIIGSAYTFDLNVTKIDIKKSLNVIPLNDSDIVKAISRSTPCVDKNNYQVCSLYNIKLTNTGDRASYSGSIITNTSTFTTTNLKYQVFTKSGSTYTAVSDQISLSNTANANNNIVKDGTNVVVTLNASSTIDYYVALWLSNASENQTSDMRKTFNGSVSFTDSEGNTQIESGITN